MSQKSLFAFFKSPKAKEEDEKGNTHFFQTNELDNSLLFLLATSIDFD